MSQLILPSRFNQQPQHLARIDRQNPLARGLVHAYLGYSQYDAAAERLLTPVVSPKMVTGGMEFSATNASVYRLATAREKSNAFTVAVLVRSLGNSSPYAAIAGVTYDNAGNSPYGDQIDRGNDGASLRFAFNVGGNAVSTNQFGNLVVGIDEWLIATFTDGYQELYRQNGGVIGTTTSGGAPSYTATSLVSIGPSTNDGRNPNVIVKASLRWDRAISRAEQAAVMSPAVWQLGKAPPRRLWVASAFAGPTYTLLTSAAGFSVSGNSARLVAARRLAAAAAGFSLISTAASLLAIRRIVAAPGALSLVGTAAMLKAARRLPAAAGAVTLAGAPAKLLAARKLAAVPGAFALTGGTATFVYTSAPGPGGPTYTLTGGSGAFLLTASTARLLIARRLVAAAGTFSATGSPAALVAKRRLSGAAGSLAITAAPAGLRATRRIFAAPASFSLTGSTATFFYTPIDKPGDPTYTLTAVGGALGLTGTGIGMRVRRRLAVAAGQLTLTGSSANLVYSQQIVYARAPAGSGYTPQTVEAHHRPVSAPSVRPAALQRNKR